MAYRTQRGIGQIFRQQLPVPEEIREQVYDKQVSLQDYVKYNLASFDIPTSFLQEKYQGVVEKFGLEKANGRTCERKNGAA